MMLLDSDVLLDVLLERHPFAEPARQLLDLIETRRLEAGVAWHSISNIHYVAAPKAGYEPTLEFIRHLATVLRVPRTDNDSVLLAADLNLNDFKDAKKVAAAAVCGAEYIVTRNRRDFRDSPIPAIEPQDALVLLS